MERTILRAFKVVNKTKKVRKRGYETRLELRKLFNSLRKKGMNNHQAGIGEARANAIRQLYQAQTMLKRAGQ